MPTVNRIGQMIFEVELNGRQYTRYTMEAIHPHYGVAYRVYMVTLQGKHGRPYERRLNPSRSRHVCCAIDCAISDWQNSREISERKRVTGQSVC